MNLPNNVLYILNRLKACGYEAYIVGGCVRDALMGIPPHDYDITTSATPEEVEEVFVHLHVIKTGLKHGTVTVMLEGEPYEITTFRVESGYSDNRHPDSVSFTNSLAEDLSRRDFTVNAMAYNPDVGVVDLFGGRADIEGKVLRCVGDPTLRFTEDALRILRLLRFASVLGFQIDESTAVAARELKERLSYVSAERIAAELCKLIVGKGAGSVLKEYVEILGAVIPELLPMKDFDQKNYHHVYDVLTHTAVAVDSAPAEKCIRLAALFHDIGKPTVFSVDEKGIGHFYGHASVSASMTETILTRLKFDNVTKSIVFRLVKWHDWVIEPTEPVVKKALGKMTPEFFRSLVLLKRADNLAQSPVYHTRQAEYDRLEAVANKILDEQECFSLKDLEVKGADLLALGVPQGKSIGLLLNRLLDAVINREVENNKEALLEKAMKWRFDCNGK